MDEKPFLEFDLLDIDDHVVPELQKLTKSAFDVDSIISAAGELKYVGQIKRVLAAQFQQPDDDFVRFFASRVYEGTITQKVRDQFTQLTRKATVQFLSDQINERLKSAITGNTQPVIVSQAPAEAPESHGSVPDQPEDKDLVVTTAEEIEGYNIVKAIVRSEVDVKRIAARDTQSYFGVLLDDNNRKPVARLHFNRPQKYLGTFDIDKVETRHPINSLDDIFAHAETLKETARAYSGT